MRYAIRAALVVLFLLAGTAQPASAGSFQDGLAAFLRTDYPTALHHWTPLATRGHTAAEWFLMFMYVRGMGARRNFGEGLKWESLLEIKGEAVVIAAVLNEHQLAVRAWTQLANQGNVVAQTSLGLMYFQGQGVPENFVEALKWFRLAASRGDAIAQYHLGLEYSQGRVVPQHYAMAARWYRLAADQGHALAQRSLGSMYSRGQGPKNDIEAVITQLASQGSEANGSAAFSLGLMYERGLGMPQNDAKALEWFKIAAGNGDADAYAKIGSMYSKGQGVPQNDAAAATWYRGEAERRQADANLALRPKRSVDLSWAARTMEYKGLGVSQSDAEVVKWHRYAADHGDVDAQLNLGAMYAEGNGVPQNYVQAHMWLNLAGAGGKGSGSGYRETIAKKMTPTQIEEAQRLAAEWKPKRQVR